MTKDLRQAYVAIFLGSISVFTRARHPCPSLRFDMSRPRLAWRRGRRRAIYRAFSSTEWVALTPGFKTMTGEHNL
jgi:hypothetical protein